MYTIGIDVGGTFTDLVVVGPDRKAFFAKSPSTPNDQSIGVMTGLGELALKLGLERSELLANTTRLVHGTTVATNALLERKGAKVALLTTEGHRDVIEMREGLKGNRYDLRTPPPEPLVPREMRFGVRERLGPEGDVRVPLDERSLDEAIAAIQASGATSIAICYLHAYRNPAHEIATTERIRQALPSAYISRSSDVWPQIKEYERVSTTIVNSYVGPAVKHYLGSLERRLAEAGFGGSLFIILSHGGMAPVEEASRLAAGTVLSGPAGGISGCRRCTELLAVPDLIPFDMGGTSTDISLIAEGRAMLTADAGLAGERIALRSLDIASIAAGGGSIASVDASGTLSVGPASAGSQPGPACYGNGGRSATVTDANVVLGYLGADTFMGGRRKLDREAAEAAVGEIAAALGISQHQAAAGIYRMVNLGMADGIRLMTLRRGVDPRRFAMISFGGAAGLHAVEVARELEIPRVIVPIAASVLSAWGMLSSDLRYEVGRTSIGSGPLDADSVRSVFADLETAARDRMQDWFAGEVRIERSAEMRYGEQIFEIDVDLDGLDLGTKDAVQQIEARFHRRHEDLYTYASPDQEVVFVNARVSAVGDVPRIAETNVPETVAGGPVSKSRRKVYFAQHIEVPVYSFEELAPGSTITGPALVEAETTTVLVGDRDVLTVNAMGWLDIAIHRA
ncbi:hydantoinase/oxoprolinase family protein [Bosea sp. (in: a-proteobacteria)]|jgi:N-methylhydantoinase A|uniref:hydantoinase/oxoprolinase family protein n=1 Tax=Bosea sp. (in: a-proteobacteria) TaxID=1871050 RepID=UPI002DDD7E49|nr:hydantoinase/oxoprolinase family protein [Bosea sp. (in: a-proteobacteria)]HEV2510287.1 hydantoinase/oxoprolinase family protein [Bosea sp. (in: a-proteobacteria)]